MAAVADCRPTAPPEPAAPACVDLSAWGDPLWRLNNLYWIQDEAGQRVPFRLNAEQARFFLDQWYLNLILKARQLGFTTLIDVMALDSCLFTPYFAAGIICHNLEDAKKIFRRKILFPYEHLPEGLKERMPLKVQQASSLVFANDSEISVSTSFRSGTLQFLHVSEFGKICLKAPDKAEEIVTGAFQAVHEGQRIYVESTGHGRGGRFYDQVQTAKKRQTEARPLSAMEFKLHFYPWWQKKEYRTDPAQVRIPQELTEYFAKLAEEGIRLDDAQKAWYAAKFAALGADKMKEEFPSTVDEPFELAIVGSYYGTILARMRRQGRMRQVPVVESVPVNTFWDLGRNDVTAIWFHQFVAGEDRFIRYYEDGNVGLKEHYEVLEEFRREHRIVWGRHFLPHDADNKNLEHNQSRVERLEELGMDPRSIVVVERIDDVNDGIELVRKALPNCWFDLNGCDQGLICLEQYQKEWDAKHGVFRNRPLHNHASNGADAFRTFAQGWSPKKGTTRESKKPRGNHRTA
jgi:hypothetical protein